jgi:ankyrin repeat protein
VALLLLDSGAELDAVNDAKQKPIDVARLNKEKALVELLEARGSKAAESS